ncbi:MAG: protein TolQ [Alphaproteobacteria bacterium]|jgi:biopolymer transport protein TolQ|nr:protein TolQ [Alphaproteobacteria bacterium]MBT5828504.1 protein TolQ [Alphaproteobacteria bacterium]
MYTDYLAISSFISDADLVVKFVIIILFLSSFVSWAIIFDKLIKFRILNFRARNFEKQFWSGIEILPLFEKIKKKDNDPLSNVFVTAINEWQLQYGLNLQDNYVKERLKERIYQAMMVTKNRAINRIQKNINFLATISSSAPFIGLFGTVWGIMNSFSAIVDAQSTSLTVVAPGIAEALFATAVGLFAAIPALIFYNLYINKLNAYNSKIEDFSVEVINLLSRELDKGQ